MWKGPKGPKLHAAITEGITYAPKVLADRPTCLITEDGSVVTIETPHLVIQIRQKT